MSWHDGSMAHLYPDAYGIAEINRLTLLLADAADQTALDTPVPTCPDWTMGDLVWHLTEVQDFWIYIISTRPGGPKYYERPKRPSDARLVGNLRNALAGLVETLRTASPTDAAWSWAEEQTVAFTLRRQTHEALTHCVDGLLTAGLPLPEVSPELAADGIDEVLAVMWPESPPEQTGTVTLATTDTNDEWTIRIGDTDARIAGSALDLNLWLWGRGNTWPLTITGDTSQPDAIRTVLTSHTS